jgi:hypothetical protein
MNSIAAVSSCSLPSLVKGHMLIKYRSSFFFTTVL